MKRLVLMCLATGCGSGDSSNTDAGPADAGVDTTGLDSAPPLPMELTSPMLAEGATFAAANTCTGLDMSIQLDWTNVGGESYAVILTDKSNNLIHWIIYDIPGSATGIPADVDKVFAPPDVAGAHQTASFRAGSRGYLGPCPPSLHTYQFAVFALDVPTLPGASMGTDRDQAKALINQHMFGTGTLTGQYEQP